MDFQQDAMNQLLIDYTDQITLLGQSPIAPGTKHILRIKLSPPDDPPPLRDGGCRLVVTDPEAERQLMPVREENLNHDAWEALQSLRDAPDVESVEFGFTLLTSNDVEVIRRQRERDAMTPEQREARRREQERRFNERRQELQRRQLQQQQIAQRQGVQPGLVAGPPPPMEQQPIAPAPPIAAQQQQLPQAQPRGAPHDGPRPSIGFLNMMRTAGARGVAMSSGHRGVTTCAIEFWSDQLRTDTN